MDKKHRLDAPNDHSLRTIEQVGDRSELSTIYPQARDQWDGDILSDTERREKYGKTQIAVSLSIRKRFITIGLLAPVPILVFGALLTFILTGVTEDNAPILVFPLMLAAAICGYLSFKAIKKVYKVFYDHALKASAFLFMLFFGIGLFLQAAQSLLQPLLSANVWLGVIYIGCALLLFSIITNGIFLWIWTSPRLRSGVKLGIIAILLGLLSAGVIAISVL